MLVFFPSAVHVSRTLCRSPILTFRHASSSSSMNVRSFSWPFENRTECFDCTFAYAYTHTQAHAYTWKNWHHIEEMLFSIVCLAIDSLDLADYVFRWIYCSEQQLCNSFFFPLCLFLCIRMPNEMHAIYIQLESWQCHCVQYHSLHSPGFLHTGNCNTYMRFSRAMALFFFAHIFTQPNPTYSIKWINCNAIWQFLNANYSVHASIFYIVLNFSFIAPFIRCHSSLEK